MLLMARAHHPPRGWTMTFPFNNSQQQQQRLQPALNYSYIDTSLAIATPHATMAPRTSTGHVSRPVCTIQQHKALAGTTLWRMASTSSP
eukprot:2988891-Amphidinium_carterae.1